MNAKHTPLPWTVFDYGKILQIDAGTADRGTTKAAVIHWAGFDSCDRPAAEKRANARLIAAAPDLLQLVTDAIEDADEFETDWNKAARAIVAKATGA